MKWGLCCCPGSGCWWCPHSICLSLTLEQSLWLWVICSRLQCADTWRYIVILSLDGYCRLSSTVFVMPCSYFWEPSFSTFSKEVLHWRWRQQVPQKPMNHLRYHSRIFSMKLFQQVRALTWTDGVGLNLSHEDGSSTVELLQQRCEQQGNTSAMKVGAPKCRYLLTSL